MPYSTYLWWVAWLVTGTLYLRYLRGYLLRTRKYIMDYEFWFWIIIAVIIGRASHRPFLYIGRDREKYDASWIGITW